MSVDDILTYAGTGLTGMIHGAANVRRLMQEETMGSIATVFPEEADHAGTYCLIRTSFVSDE